MYIKCWDSVKGGEGSFLLGGSVEGSTGKVIYDLSLKG